MRANVIDTNDEEGEWKSHRVQTEDDYRRVLSNVKRTYEVFGGQAILEEEIIVEEDDFSHYFKRPDYGG